MRSAFDRGQFDHVGIPVTEPMPGEMYFAEQKIWLTSPRAHPANVEYLRFEPDSPAEEARKREVHIAYRVQNLAEAITGLRVVSPPADFADGFMQMAFVRLDGALLELIQYRDPQESGWPQL